MKVHETRSKQGWTYPLSIAKADHSLYSELSCRETRNAKTPFKLEQYGDAIRALTFNMPGRKPQKFGGALTGSCNAYP
jgi:hypothetical protein